MSERVHKNSSYLNGKSTVGTNTRVKDTSTISGMCPICIRDCPVLCEISLSAFRGREALYPEPAQFGTSTAGALKNFGLDWSHFSIQAGLFDAQGIAETSEAAIFPNAKTETKIGGMPLKLPILTGAFGSTEVARANWDALAIGAALSGVSVTIGENIAGMDIEATLANDKITHSPELKRRVDSFRKFWDGKYGDVIIQTNVEDQRLGIDAYALSKLEVNIIERKWGQGAKAIGGEVRLKDLQKAILLKKRGYIVIPDPEDPVVQQAFKDGVFNTFERHSRVGIPKEKSFIEDIEWLRKPGAKKVFLKTGAYRPSAVAYTMKWASEAKIDALSFDGAGGGTGMSPVPMMDEMSIPTLYLQALVMQCAQILKKKGKYVPDLVMAGGFIEETIHIQNHRHEQLRRRTTCQSSLDGSLTDYCSHESKLLQTTRSRRQTTQRLRRQIRFSPREILHRDTRAQSKIRRTLQRNSIGKHRRLHIPNRQSRRWLKAVNGRQPQMEP